MAQTISVVKGTTTCADSSSVTLYTNSGGIASRVIPNMISWYANSNGIAGSGNLNFFSSAGGSCVIGYYKGPYGSGQGQFMPANNGVGPLQYGGNSSYVSVNGAIAAGGAVGTYIGAWPANYAQPSGSAMSYLPSNFWMSPSDYLTFSWQAGTSVTIAYSFTIITES